MKQYSIHHIFKHVAVVATILFLWTIISPQTSFSSGVTNKPLLTEEEQRYLRDKKALTMVIDQNYMPFDALDEDSKHTGMAADYIALLSERIGVTFEIIPTESWTDSLAKAKAGEVDIVSMLNKTPDRSEYLDFTDPFFLSEVVIVARERVWLVNGLDDIKDEPLAVGEGYWVEESIQRDYPEINLVPAKSTLDGLRQVAANDAFATVATLIEAAYLIQKEGFDHLKIVGHTKYNTELRVGVRKEDKVLLSILQKGVRSLSDREKNDIFAKWATVPIQHIVDYTLLWKMLSALALIMLVFLYWNRKLHKLNSKIARAHAELALKNEELESLSITDRLTGLHNRMKLDDALKNEISRIERYNHTLSIILMDIDHFKMVNDKLGHQAGDDVLKDIASTLRDNVRDVDIVGRWGGEEFLIICPETNLDGACTIAEKLRSKMENWDLDRISATGSFGVAELISGDKEEDILRRADHALYKAKEKGRNRVEKA